MKRAILLSSLFVATAGVVGCQQHHEPKPMSASAMSTTGLPATKPAKLVTNVGNVQHPVSTQNAEAQKFFNQGLAYVYAFNHAEAIRSFQRAGELDPTLAMAWWGQSLALGPNINKEIDPAEAKAAFDAVQKAKALEKYASPKEKAYIDALTKRYSADPKADLKKLAVEYNLAMGQVVKQYPDDLDAATLYAESGMNLRPWKLYTRDGNPEEGTEQIVMVLESVLARDPNHTGANHYYIHATEASLRPDRAIPSANRLPSLAPGAGHLVHMPAHVWIRTGDYQKAIAANEQAAKVDEEYISCCGPKGGFYPAVYYSHNLHFLAVAATMSGQSKVANEAGARLARNIAPIAREVLLAQPFLAMPVLFKVRFAEWDDILNLPPADESMPSVAMVDHFARGMAHTAKKNLADAGAEQAKFEVAAGNVGDAMFSNNQVSLLAQIARQVLAGKIAAARGDDGAAIQHLQLAVAAQEQLVYDEPPPWPWSIRETLGAALLKQGAAADAEAVFRKDLVMNLNNPRSLLGLAASLRAQGKDQEAQQIQQRADAALKYADVEIRIEDF